MSRKARSDRSQWHTASIYAFAGDYGHFKPRGQSPIEDALILLKHMDDKNADAETIRGRHPMYSIASEAQNILLRTRENEADSAPFSCMIVFDIRSMVEDIKDLRSALARETEEVELTKGFGKTLLRLFQRLHCRNVTLAAYRDACPVLLKVYKALQKKNPNICKQMWLLHPLLPTKFVNKHLLSWGRTQPRTQDPHLLNLVFECETSRDRRLPMLRHLFPRGKTKIIDKSVCSLLVASLQDDCFGALVNQHHMPRDYDPEYCNPMGKSLFLSLLTVEMSPYTKQYERHVEDITSDILTVKAVTTSTGDEHDLFDPSSSSSVDWSTCERHIGALVLRGNRCVLVRSLRGTWTGMRIPSVAPLPEESPQQAAVRCVVEFTEVDASEVTILPDEFVPPVALFAPNGRPVLVQLYALYATGPPPDGPLEDADMEDEESPYDWYTYPNAVKKLDDRSVSALQTVSWALLGASVVRAIPCRWGGVFGQEWTLRAENSQNVENGAARHHLAALAAVEEEWTPSSAGDMLQDVRKANKLLMQRLASTKDPRNAQNTFKLPVTLLSGFLGSGKTTLLSHILSNYDGLRVAILVNDMGQINIDAALVKNAAFVRQRKEHMVEMSNGCICCTLREDLITEVAKIASEGTFDYLLVESSGISEPLPVAETFTFEDSTGLRLGDVAEIDTLVTVVDGSRFLSELESLESLRDRDWKADPQDERTISHLLCDQVEFSNVIVLNKCDLVDQAQKEKVKLLIESMNPTAKLVEAEFSAVPLDTVLGTGLFSMSDAEKYEGWLREARIGEHTPETEEYGISSFVFKALRPFHPFRLYQSLEAMVAKRGPYKDSIVLRGKGFIWLANCPQLQGNFSLAGRHYSLLPGNPWWAEIDKLDWPENLERDIAPIWHELFGDRQQEVVIIGQLLKRETITQALESCLLSEEEMALGQDEWYELCKEHGDPFQEAWDEAVQTIINDHMHDHVLHHT